MLCVGLLCNVIQSRSMGEEDLPRYGSQMAADLMGFPEASPVVLYMLFRRKSFQCILFMDTTDSLCQIKLAEVMKVCTHSLTGRPFSDSRQPFHCLLLSFGLVRKHSRLNVLCLFHSSTLSNQSSWFFLDADFL